MHLVLIILHYALPTTPDYELIILSLRALLLKVAMVYRVEKLFFVIKIN